MLSEFNWALIRSPQTYENLIGTLLAFEYPDFARYSRPGRDAGIDGQSRDGNSIWQFKFHSTPTLSRVPNQWMAAWKIFDSSRID